MTNPIKPASSPSSPNTPNKPNSTKFDITAADFKLFTVIWNQRMKQTTPQIHLDMAGWLEHNWERGNRDMLLMAFRSAGKSTIVGLFAAWLLYCNPDLRVLVLAADFSLAKKMVHNVKRILERHPLTSNKLLALKSDKAEQWASDRFTVKRLKELRDPSMMAKGITSNITGSRADIVICDDVEVPNTCDSMEKRRELRNRLAEMEFVLAEGGSRLYVGTPHHYHTIYAENPRAEFGEEGAFLTGFRRLSIPVLDAQGQSNWEERYSLNDIKRTKHSAGPNRFASQMMLTPRNINEGRLNADLLQIYDDPLDYSRELQPLFIGQTKMIAVSAFWDPAFGSAKGDHSVMAIIFSDDAGNLYLHHIAYIKINEQDPRDEATQQCAQIAAIAKAHYLPALTVEINGIGRFLPKILRNEMAKAKAPCKVNEISQTRAKDIRILEAFDAVLAARRLYVHRDVLQTPFMTEMREWRPASSRGHDDGIDAASGALAQCPDRLSRIYGQGAHNWMRQNKSHKADTDFKV